MTTAAATSGSGKLVFTVTRTGDLTNAVAVGYTVGGSAVVGTDYVALPGTVSLGVGVASATIEVTPVWNGSVRPDRVVSIQLTAGSGYNLVGQTGGSGTISDTAWDDVSLSVPVNSVTESGTGAIPAIFRITRPATSNTTRAITVNYTIGGTAVPTVNYLSVSGSAVIPVGGISVDIPIVPQTDHVNTADLSVILTLAPGQFYNVGAPGMLSSGTATIQNVPENSLVSLVTSATSVLNTEGTLSFTVNRTGVKSEAILVNYRLGGSAVNGIDYEPLSGNIAVPANSSSATIVVRPIWTETAKLPQVVTVELTTGVGYDLLGNTFGSGSITYAAWDNAYLWVTQPNASEPSSSLGITSGTAVFHVLRTGDTNRALTVYYTATGSATPGLNYVPLTGSATIPAGATSTDISVTPLNDHINNAGQTLALTLVSGSNYHLGTLASGTGSISGTATIANTPDNQVSVVTTTNALESGQNGVFTISRSGTSLDTLTVGYTVGGTAVSGTDYVKLSGTAVIPAGKSSTTVPVVPVVNPRKTTSPTVVLAITGSNQYLVDPLRQSATVTIQNYTGPIVAASAAVPNALVTGSASAIVRVYRWGPLSWALPVKYTIGGTARKGYDYVAVSGSLLMPAGKSYADIKVTPINRGQSVGSYSVIVTLAPQAGKYVIAQPSAATVNMVSPGPAQITVAPDSTASSVFEGYGAVRAIFTRTNGDPTKPLTIYYGTAGGTAKPGVNFVATSGTVTIPANTDHVGVSFTSIHDGVITAADLTLIVLVKPGPGYTVPAPAQTTLIIKDVDLHGPTF